MINSLKIVTKDGDFSFLAKAEVAFGMCKENRGTVVMLVNGEEKGRAKISADVYGNGLNRYQTEKKLFSEYMKNR